MCVLERCVIQISLVRAYLFWLNQSLFSKNPLYFWIPLQLGVGIHVWIKFFQGNDKYVLTDSHHGDHLYCVSQR